MTGNAHGKTYSDDFVQQVLGSVKTIAMVGASGNPTKASYDVLQFMIAAGYDMIPVNPRPDVTEIQGLAVYSSLKSIDRPVDMVEVFRPSPELVGFAREAVDIGAKVFWAQLGIYDAEAKRIAEQGGLKVVMDRCPKIELAGRPR
jgi:predicted CoA-binding protein